MENHKSDFELGLDPPWDVDVEYEIPGIPHESNCEQPDVSLNTIVTKLIQEIIELKQRVSVLENNELKKKKNTIDCSNPKLMTNMDEDEIIKVCKGYDIVAIPHEPKKYERFRFKLSGFGWLLYWKNGNISIQGSDVEEIKKALLVQ